MHAGYTANGLGLCLSLSCGGFVSEGRINGRSWCGEVMEAAVVFFLFSFFRFMTPVDLRHIRGCLAVTKKEVIAGMCCDGYSL